MLNEGNIVPPNSPFEELQEKLEPFLEINLESKLIERGESFAIESPWGDPTVLFQIDRTDDELITALNSIYLPPRFTAIWHRDSRDFEIIFTAHPIRECLKTRSFEFQLEDKSYRCEFGCSSDRWMKIAMASRMAEAATETDHRNVQSFSMYGHHVREHPDSEPARTWAPISFWIRSINWDEDRVIELAQHLNFFMQYSDPETPLVLIHRAQTPTASQFKDPFGFRDEFPSTVRGRPIDPHLLGLWESSADADPLTKFLYLFQILEYCAFYQIQEEILRVIRRSIQAPDLLGRVDEIAREILDAFVEDRLQEPEKFVLGLVRCVDPKRLWDYIEPNRAHFAKETHFHGGFCLQPLINEDWTVDDFCHSWTPKFANSLRKIRNALVHAREARMVEVIAPTQDNYDKLAPWLPPLKIAAMEAMLFGL